MTKGVSYEQYQRNRLLQLGVERLLTTVGEAARPVSESVRQAHPEIPWRQITGQRNVLVHQYDEIIEHSLWEVITVHFLRSSSSCNRWYQHLRKTSANASQ